MALIKCKECGHEISTKAKACPNCGYEKKPVQIGCLASIIIIAFVIYFINGLMQSGTGGNTPTSSTRQNESKQVVALTPEQKAEQEKQRLAMEAVLKEQEERRLGLHWSYSESPDEMGRGTIKKAIVKSLSEFEFGFPYNGAQRATLLIRDHPKYGKDIVIIIDQGQFLCGLDNCKVSIKFDEGKPQAYDANEPADNSTTYLFLANYDRFIKDIKKAKKLYIEATFYQEGSRVFEFDVSGLNW